MVFDTSKYTIIYREYKNITLLVIAVFAAALMGNYNSSKIITSVPNGRWWSDVIRSSWSCPGTPLAGERLWLQRWGVQVHQRGCFCSFHMHWWLFDWVLLLPSRDCSIVFFYCLPGIWCVALWLFSLLGIVFCTHFCTWYVELKSTSCI